MHEIQGLLNRIKELEELQELSERKTDILTNLLKEASAEFEKALGKVTQSEANFRAVFENAPEAIYIIDTDTRQILDCNPYTSEWLGYERHELVSMRVEDILEPGAQGVSDNIQKAIELGLVRIQERRFRKKNGTIVDSEVTGTLIEYEGRRCMVVLVRDITERKRIQELFRYKELFENVSDPVFINHSQGNFLEVNDVACECFGYPRNQLLKMTVKDLAKPGQNYILSEMGERIRRGETVQFELETLTKEGELIPFEFHAKPIVYGGKPAVLSVARDLSIRKKMQETLISTERLTALGEMASGIAHNFNNLLQMIMGAGEAALVKLDSGRIRRCREAITNILHTSHRAAEVVRRIKDFTDSRTSEIDEAEAFDLGKLIHEAAELTKPLWKNLPDSRKYKLNLVGADGYFVKGKPSEIYEVLVNLIKNALEAMPHGGALTISSDIQDGKIQLKVSDTGHGIPEENLQRVFEPFFTTKGSRSSGLGLASSYGIVKRHQGEMFVESIAGHGTTFTIALPMAERPAEEKVLPKAPAKAPQIKFLLIDDEVNILKMMEMVLEESEVEIVTALKAEEGLKIFRQGGFDVILCDLGMDDMNGWEVGEEIKEYCRKQGIAKPPFLLYTGLDKRLEPKKLEESGVDRVVAKPIPSDDLLGILREVVSSGSPPIEQRP
jgi:two-component system, cell cycle sensor histidine kinase and response regulator CckA